VRVHEHLKHWSSPVYQQHIQTTILSSERYETSVRKSVAFSEWHWSGVLRYRHLPNRAKLSFNVAIIWEENFILALPQSMFCLTKDTIRLRTRHARVTDTTNPFGISRKVHISTRIHGTANCCFPFYQILLLMLWIEPETILANEANQRADQHNGWPASRNNFLFSLSLWSAFTWYSPHSRQLRKCWKFFALPMVLDRKFF